MRATVSSLGSGQYSTGRLVARETNPAPSRINRSSAFEGSPLQTSPAKNVRLRKQRGSLTSNPTEAHVQPGADELELTVFGGGFGESICVHVGGGSWVIVDSCID